MHQKKERQKKKRKKRKKQKPIGESGVGGGGGSGGVANVDQGAMDRLTPGRQLASVSVRKIKSRPVVKERLIWL